MDAMSDPLVERFKPDRELVALAQRQMMDDETHAQRFLRQRWEHAMGAARVTLDSLREIWPSEQASLPEADRSTMGDSLRLAEDLAATLDRLSDTMLGEAMVRVLMGVISTAEELDASTEPPSEKQRIMLYACAQPERPLPPSPSVLHFEDELLRGGWVERRQHGGPLYPTSKAMDAYPGFTELG
jgi:hypothetical protein